MWKVSSQTKIYEALGAVADERMEIVGNSGRCYSSSRNKFYDINFEPSTNAIMSNDNTSYWTGELGYPAIAFLLKKGVLEYRNDLAVLLKGVLWKDINQKFKNDFDAALEFVLKDFEKAKRDELNTYTSELVENVKKLKLKELGDKVVPPSGY